MANNQSSSSIVPTRFLGAPQSARRLAILVANMIGKALLRVRVRGIPRLLAWSGPLVVGSGVRLVTTATGTRLCIDGRDYFACMMFYGRFAPELIGLIRKLVRTGDYVIDVGAQLGYVSIALAKSVGGDGKVYAFEPDPTARERLDYAVRANDLPQIHVFPNALSNTTGEIMLHVSPVVGWSTAVSETHLKNLERIQVNAWRLDDLISESRIRRPIRLIKIDVEGYEAAVLDGMQNLLFCDKPTIVVEVNPHLLAAAGHTSADLLRRLSQFGYLLYRLSERRGILSGGSPKLTPVRVSDRLDFCDVVAVSTSEDLDPDWLKP